jgi:hypothetical protein
MNIVVVPEEIRGDFPSPLELAVFSNHSLNLFHERVFGVVAGDAEGSVVGVLKLLGVCEPYDPGRNRNSAVGSRLIKPDFQEYPVFEAGDRTKVVS